MYTNLGLIYDMKRTKSDVQLAQVTYVNLLKPSGYFTYHHV